ncbi:MAG: Gfo/Idh/MocA family oxidoreductase [Chloroflexi bacterium]|nr:Gfo/Idh/MocA family oxidoreductase [Chloroflexota bacterium]
MIEVALVGCAHIHTPGFVKRLQARSDVKLVAIWDHDQERAQKWATETNAPVVTDLNEIWSNAAISAVIICAETNRHEPLVLAAAAANKHMFVEKPLGIGTDDAYKMADAIEKAGVIFQTGYFQRGNPVHLYLREQIQKGSFGKITRIRHSNCHSGSLGDWFTPQWLWMTDVEQAGVGAFGDLGTHSLDILMWLMGDVVRATASIHVATGRYGECDEFGEGLLEFKNGAVGSLAAGWVDVAHPISVIISGTEGHAYVANDQLFFQSSHVEGADGKTPWTALPTAWPHAFELFLDAANGKQGVELVGAREAADRSAVMEALYQAAQQQAWLAPKR